jgi:hypothetical protein
MIALPEKRAERRVPDDGLRSAAPAFFLPATSHREARWRLFRPWLGPSYPPTPKRAFCGLDRNVPARRPELRARSDPRIVRLKRG